jgi:hypothetical protein
MSFWKNAFVFASGAIVGAAALTAFTGYQAFKLLKKNDTLYSAVEESVKAGVHTGGNELGNRLAKIVTDKVFDTNQRDTHIKHAYVPTIDAAAQFLAKYPDTTLRYTDKGYELTWED